MIFFLLVRILTVAFTLDSSRRHDANVELMTMAPTSIPLGKLAFSTIICVGRYIN